VFALRALFQNRKVRAAWSKILVPALEADRLACGRANSAFVVLMVAWCINHATPS
jgi:hypothetical protein